MSEIASRVDRQYRKLDVGAVLQIKVERSQTLFRGIVNYIARCRRLG